MNCCTSVMQSPTIPLMCNTLGRILLLCAILLALTGGTPAQSTADVVTPTPTVDVAVCESTQCSMGTGLLSECSEVKIITRRYNIGDHCMWRVTAGNNTQKRWRITVVRAHTQHCYDHLTLWDAAAARYLVNPQTGTPHFCGVKQFLNVQQFDDDFFSEGPEVVLEFKAPIGFTGTEWWKSGVQVNLQVECRPGWRGDNCDQLCCLNGVCDPTTMTCERCFNGWRGPKCDVAQTLDSGWGLRMDFAAVRGGRVTGRAGPPCDAVAGAGAGLRAEAGALRFPGAAAPPGAGLVFRGGTAAKVAVAAPLRPAGGAWGLDLWVMADAPDAYAPFARLGAADIPPMLEVAVTEAGGLAVAVLQTRYDAVGAPDGCVFAWCRVSVTWARSAPAAVTRITVYVDGRRVLLRKTGSVQVQDVVVVPAPAVEGRLELGALPAFGGRLRDVRVWLDARAPTAPPFPAADDRLFLHYPLDTVEHPWRLGLTPPPASLPLYTGVWAVRDRSGHARHGYLLLNGPDIDAALPGGLGDAVATAGAQPGPGSPGPAPSVPPEQEPTALRCVVHNCVRSAAPSEYRGYSAAPADADERNATVPAPAPACEAVATQPVCGERGWPMPPSESRVCGASPVAELGCWLNVTQPEAAAACASLDARLCSSAELGRGIGSGTGCGLDHLPVWSSTPCNTTAGASGFETLRLAPGPKEVACAVAAARHGLRCCAEEPATGHYDFTVGAWVRYDAVPALQLVLELRSARHSVGVWMARRSGFQLRVTSPLQNRSAEVTNPPLTLTQLSPALEYSRSRSVGTE